MSKTLPTVVIVGPTNVGKSTIFNRLVGSRLAITDSSPHTTRNQVSQIVSSQGSTWRLVDTAGAIDSKDRSVAKPLVGALTGQISEAYTNASAILLVIDSSQPITEALRRQAKALLKTGKPLLLVVNRVDQTGGNAPAEVAKLGIKEVVATSATHNLGIDQMVDWLNKQLPKVKVKPVVAPGLALVGRPNVGKTTLFNKLSGNQAIIDNQAGTTRDLNTAEIKQGDQTWQLFDTAGIRRPGSRTKLETFSWERTQQAIATAEVVALLIDATEPAVALEQKIAGEVKTAGKGLILIINKWDLIEDGAKGINILEKRLRAKFDFVPWAPWVVVSAGSGHNVAKIWELAAMIYRNRQAKHTTSQLNRIMTDAVAKHPPAGVKNSRPKLRYITQTGVSPPTFSIFGQQSNKLHWSYQRYLETQLRNSLDLTGTPVQLEFRAGAKP